MRRLYLIGVTAGLNMAAPVYAYVGPGPGIGAVGTLVAVIAVLVLAIAGAIWYPVKRLLGRGQSPAHSDVTAEREGERG